MTGLVIGARYHERLPMECQRKIVADGFAQGDGGAGRMRVYLSRIGQQAIKVIEQPGPASRTSAVKPDRGVPRRADPEAAPTPIRVVPHQKNVGGLSQG